MTAHFALPPPAPLEIHDKNAFDKWKKFSLAWSNYSLATELNKKNERVQVATLLTVIGEEARDVFSTFTDWENEGDEYKINPVLKKFADYCEPRKNVPFNRYKFNCRNQEPGETYDKYKTALRKLAEGCDFEKITVDEILRDRLLFGIRDSDVRRRLFRETSLSLTKTDQICRAFESTVAQMKIVEGSSGAVHEVCSAKTKEQQSSKRQPKKIQTSQTRHKECKECDNCATQHETDKTESCPAHGKICRRCGKKNHFAVKCRSRMPTNSRQSTVKAVDTDSEEERVYMVDLEAAALDLDDSQLVTLRLESGKFIRFQPDTGAQCNVLPVHIYKKATNDENLDKVNPTKASISAYGGSKLPVVGEVRIRVWRGELKCLLECKLVDSTRIRPLLSRRACIGMNILEYKDNDELNKPVTNNSSVYSVERLSKEITKEELTSMFPEVFADGVGEMEGEYRIRLDDSVAPVQHAPRRMAVALRDQLKDTLDDLAKQGVIAPVSTPTPWISSIIAVPKKNGKLRICLDPKDLNRAIQRENYQLPTIEDVATRLHGAKVFTKLDLRNGFWHVKLTEESSYLTTFQTPFGRYRWRRMPFGLSSAPEVFQRKMHEFSEGLTGIEVVADDFIAIGYGETTDKANKDHDDNLLKFLQRCKDKGVKLNDEKLVLRQPEVLFIGHVTTGDGLRVDPAKIKAITEMPTPSDKASVQRLLGMAQYLSKFLPHLSDITRPLRELTHQDSEWCWQEQHQTALNQLKEALTQTPVLRYYNVKEEVTLQCDASQFGLGASLLQNGQPVAYASRALTPAEIRYAQIEKELLAIVFACEKFETYIYGRDKVTVETDHKPLEPIFVKPLDSAPSRLQRMLLRLQKYTLHVHYKRGKEMFLADTLSRAFLSDVNTCDLETELEKVDHKAGLPISEGRWHQLSQTSADDQVLQQLRAVVHQGWPDDKADIPECLHPYFAIRDELVVQDNFVFKGQQLVVPKALRKELMEVTHSSHIGLEGCLRRARDAFYWPRMSTELRDYISKCDICLAHRNNQGKEPIVQHDMAARPWSKVAVDLCDFDNRTLLVMCDYFSNFIEVARLKTVNSRSVIKEMRETFARYGIPDSVVSDNGPQFSSAEFAVFAESWGFDHVTSSPRYPQSNGKAENAVKTIKRLFTKCKASGQSEFLALLDWRNTPTAGIGTSPAQRLMGRRCKTLLPMSDKLLQPRYSTEQDARGLIANKRRQEYYYNQHTKPLDPIAKGDVVCMKTPGQSNWSKGVCIGQAATRSYNIRVGAGVYRRNRRHIVKTQQHTLPEEIPPMEEEIQESEQRSPTLTEGLPAPRRSLRTRTPPKWMEEYET